MKKLAVCFLVMFCLLGLSNAFAGTHLANIVWTTSATLVVGYDSANNGSYVYADSFDLDIGATDYYYTVNGIVTSTQGQRQACTGTGFIDQFGQINLDMQCGTSQVVFVLDGNGNGTANVIDYNDIYIDWAPISLYGIY